MRVAYCVEPDCSCLHRAGIILEPGEEAPSATYLVVEEESR